MQLSNSNKVLAVAVSGGADSLYSLLRLKEEGANVFALHALLLPPELRFAEYPAMLEGLQKACNTLGVELVITDLSAKFTELVIAPFIKAYSLGYTPNPCAFCNRHIKFGLLREAAFKHGANTLVTGHYVKSLPLYDTAFSKATVPTGKGSVTPVPANAGATVATATSAAGNSSINAEYKNTSAVTVPHSSFNTGSAGAGSAVPVAIYAASDSSKDQSYFLSLTPIHSLAAGFFPLANLQKSEVLAYLEQRGLEVPQKGESQEICFVTNNDYRLFLQEHSALPGADVLRAKAEADKKQFAELKKAAKRSRKPLPELQAALQQAEQLVNGKFNAPVASSGAELTPHYGPALLQDGTRVGTHYGLWNYTQGQRHGLGLAWKEPLFVLGKDLTQNALIVGPKATFAVPACLCGSVNFLVPPAEWPDIVLAKTRYRQALCPARYKLYEEQGDIKLKLEFEDEPGPPAAPGQVAALYHKTENGLRLLAGAVIES